jgi:hypothetical protein
MPIKKPRSKARPVFFGILFFSSPFFTARFHSGSQRFQYTHRVFPTQASIGNGLTVIEATAG